jgi:starch phosphorylase
MKPKLRTVQVTPVLPEALEALEELAYNLCWDWMPEIASLFHRVDPDLWERSGRNPVALLGQVDQRRLEALSSDIGFLAHLGRARELLARYKVEPRWFQTEHVESSNIRIAYFSAEFGLTGCLPIYSGGLGILAGDHLKSASDLGLPLVGVGLLYQEGYFRQYLNADGWQMETYPPNDFYNMPLTLVKRNDGSVVRISVEFPGRDVFAQVWRIDVGRVPLFLLDTNVLENSPQDRKITRALYSGGVELRIQQLMMLGIGGFRALIAMGLEPSVCHMNEGHAGFLAVERVRFLMAERGMSYELARDTVDDGNLFTTHTPVPAGFDVFGKDLVERHMSAYVHKLGLSVSSFMGLGRRNKDDDREPLNMAVLAIRHAVQRNGVSALHGRVSRALVQNGGAWTEWPIDEVPIDAVTNGIHTRTWIAPEMAKLLDRYLGPSWRDEIMLDRTWAAVDNIPNEELWRAHVDMRQQLVSYVRSRLHWQLMRRGAPDRELNASQQALNPDALTIGFARRFATYKRATLLFQDPARLAKIVARVDRPVQLIFSGKAHPADAPAKEYIKLVASKLKDEAFARSIIFLEDYEIPVAKQLVRGVDVWLNNPQRPKEASGTSGMKVLPNGGLNCSILDGWWAEGYRPGVGWSIGNGEDWIEGRDEVEASALYDLLETQIVPLFYARDSRGVPHDWVRMMKASMKALTSRFSTDRMVVEYVERFYLPTARRVAARLAGDVQAAEALVSWKSKVQRCWNQIRVRDISASAQEARIGEPFMISARLELGQLSPDDVDVQLYHGALDARDEIHDAATVSMTHVGFAEGIHTYTCKVPFKTSGRYGYTVRVIPRHRDVLIPNELEVIRWADT